MLSRGLSNVMADRDGQRERERERAVYIFLFYTDQRLEAKRYREWVFWMSLVTFNFALMQLRKA